PCTAMVFVWSNLTKGEPHFTLSQVALNDAIMVVAFAPIVGLLLGLSAITVPWGTLVLSVVLYIVIPVIIAQIVRRRMLANGGQAALELARDGADIVLAASFHGLLDTLAPARPSVVKTRILVCHGDADPMVSREQVIAFWEEMDAAGAGWHFHSYSGVKHGFTDPGSDARGMAAIGYDASADRQSWGALMDLLDEVLS
ncbi:MAG: hypothetical protein B7X78_05710, partial [Sphingomonadales bacterium 39-62-4]